MTHVDYYFRHAIPTGWKTIQGAFRAWRDLITGNWAAYALAAEDDPYEECHGWFWQLLGEDNVYPKAFLEHLDAVVKRINNGDEHLIAVELENLMNELDEHTFEEDFLAK